jgi:hypothetical protein
MQVTRVIRVFPDWGHEWPLWEDSSPTRESTYTMEPSDYGLSEVLTAELRRWYYDWERCVRPFDRPSWIGPPTAEGWEATGRLIADKLQAEVASFARVHYEV